MGKKIFVSYKYHDSNVRPIQGNYSSNVRDYVDLLENYLDKSDNIYKGESEGEDLSNLSDNEIWKLLKERIYDSSVTIVVISPNMKEVFKSDRSQWIPWEVSFSLRETVRNDRKSHRNAMIAVVLPDRNGSYSYFIENKKCGCLHYRTEELFSILKHGMFNSKKPDKLFCNTCGREHYMSSPSYIDPVKWDDFVQYPNYYINAAVERQDNIDDYDIKVTVE